MNVEKYKYHLAFGSLFLGFILFGVLPQSVDYSKLDSYSKGIVISKSKSYRKGISSSIVFLFNANGRRYQGSLTLEGDVFDAVGIGYPFIIKYEKKNPSNSEALPWLTDSTFLTDTTLRIATIDKIRKERIRTIRIKGWKKFYCILFHFYYENEYYQGVRFVKEKGNIKAGDRFYALVNTANPSISMLDLNQPFIEEEFIKDIEAQIKEMEAAKKDSNTKVLKGNISLEANETY